VYHSLSTVHDFFYNAVEPSSMSGLRLLTSSRRTHYAVASAGTGFGTLQSQGTRFEVLRAVLIWHRVDWCIGFGGACRLHLQGSVPVYTASCCITADVLLQNCVTISTLSSATCTGILVSCCPHSLHFNSETEGWCLVKGSTRPSAVVTKCACAVSAERTNCTS
jgi:hypothetical protein